MIESKNDTSRNSVKALQALKQAKQRVANEKKKQNEKKRKAEIRSLQSECDSIGKEQTEIVTESAYAEVISYNKKNLERELQNESRQHNKQQGKAKRRGKKFNRNMSVAVV